MTPAVQIRNLTRCFGDLVAVDNISFSIEKGEIFGLLGPNGAGKTTTLSMLATMLEPTSGSASVNGIGIAQDPDGVSFTAFGIAIASRMEDMTGFQLIMNFVIFPIFGFSGALFPISSLPGWVAPVTYLDPMTYGVEGIRYGLTGTSQISPVICLAVIALFSIATSVIGAFLFRKIRM